MTVTDFPQAQIEADKDVPIIRITRDFHATAAQLLRAHTDPELFVRWNVMDGMTNRIVEWDARDGGCWHYVGTQDASGEEFGFRGCFHTVGPDRIVQTFTYLGMPDDVALETMRFEDLGDGRTRLHAQSLCDSFAARDAWLSSGMEEGVNAGYANIDRMAAAGEL